MNVLAILIPVSLGLGGAAMAFFVWCLRHSQFDDPDGDAARILDRDDGRP